jgi:hypothetical protein
MRLVHLLAVSALSVSTVLTAAPPAQAGPPPLCFKEYDLLHHAGAVRAYGYQSCVEADPAPLGVALQRLNPSTGTWSRVAEGIGEAAFTCFGNGRRTYRHAQQRSLTLTVHCT